MSELSEFELIQRYFTRATPFHSESELGIGDDCALLNIPEGYQLAVTSDTLVEKIHFFADANPEDIGFKALAVNLSDLAAMGAEPRWVTLALTLPEVSSDWLEQFSKGFFELATSLKVDLIGGDTTRGPLSISVTAMGVLPGGAAMRRSGAKVGDIVCLTGNIGAAGLGLVECLGNYQTGSTACIQSLNRPLPQIAAGLVIRDYAHACIDISDGLCADLGHILEASQKGAKISWSDIPLNAWVKHYVDQTGDWKLPLTAGDDYQLCFTMSPGDRADCFERLAELGCTVTSIGIVTGEQGELVVDRNNTCFHFDPDQGGYQHF